MHSIASLPDDEGPRLRVARRRRQPGSTHNRVDRYVTDHGITIELHRTVPTQNRRMDRRNNRHLAHSSIQCDNSTTPNPHHSPTARTGSDTRCKQWGRRKSPPKHRAARPPILISALSPPLVRIYAHSKLVVFTHKGAR